MSFPLSLVELSVVTGLTLEELDEELPGLIEEGLVIEVFGGYLVTQKGLEEIEAE